VGLECYKHIPLERVRQRDEKKKTQVMKPVKTIELPKWFKTNQTIQLMKVLNNNDTQPKALFVGGCIRNALMEASETDVDIATQWTPEQVMEHLDKAEIKSIPTGIDHGTVTAVIDRQPFEITTLRKDVETDGRHAVVAFTEDWRKDAQRRDFTMNTLLADIQGNIYDPTEQGLKDLESKKVVFVGEPEQRIAEDYLRILRFFRFHAWYGDSDIDPQALQACKAAADQILTLSKERITQEVSKLLQAKFPIEVLGFMNQNKILPELFHVKHKSNVLRNYYNYNNTDLSAVLFILSAFDPEHIDVMEQRMTFSNAVKRKYKSLSNAFTEYPESDEKSVKKLIYFYGNEIASQTLQIQNCEDQKALEIAKNWQAPEFAITGDDLKKEGYKSGPELGEELKRREEEWLKEVL